MMRRRLWALISGGLLLGGCTAGAATETATMPTTTEIATFGGGCFWCMQPPYDDLPGVLDTVVGYTGGTTPNPTYEQVSSGTTGHAEAVQITFDPATLSYVQLVDVFWRSIEPTQTDGQFADTGSQYRTAIFYHSEAQRAAAEASKQRLQDSGKFTQPIATQIVPATTFYPAEAHHQDYYKHHPLRYQQYKEGSGRAGFLRRTWSESH